MLSLQVQSLTVELPALTWHHPAGTETLTLEALSSPWVTAPSSGVLSAWQTGQKATRAVHRSEAITLEALAALPAQVAVGDALILHVRALSASRQPAAAVTLHLELLSEVRHRLRRLC